MATILVCDGGCGAQSPDPQSGSHVGNNWLRVRAEINHRFKDGERWDDKLFCKACTERVGAALKPQPKQESGHHD